MRSEVLAETRNYRLTSFGRGLAYELLHKPTGKSVYVQGDDALAFGVEWETTNSVFTTIKALDHMWWVYEPVARETHEPLGATT